jgi:drug/metabolite transporter (DMT)-like permease
MFGTFIPAYLFAIAQTQIDSSVSSILNSLTPLNTLILGALVLITIQTQSNFWYFNRFGSAFVDFEWSDSSSRTKLLLLF